MEESNKDLAEQLKARKREQTRQLESHQGQNKAKQKVIDTLHKEKKQLKKEYDALYERNVTLTNEVNEVTQERDDLRAGQSMDELKIFAEFAQELCKTSVKDNEEMAKIMKELLSQRAMLRPTDLREPVLDSYTNAIYWTRLCH